MKDPAEGTQEQHEGPYERAREEIRNELLTELAEAFCRAHVATNANRALYDRWLKVNLAIRENKPKDATEALKSLLEGGDS